MITVRKIKKSDLERVVFILNQLSPHNENVDSFFINGVFDDIASDNNYYVNVCEIDGLVVGTSQLFVQKNLSHGGRSKGHIENVVVDSSYRSRGIGRLLVDDLLLYAKKMGCYKVILNCGVDKSDFYKRLGFRKTGELEMRIDI